MSRIATSSTPPPKATGHQSLPLGAGAGLSYSSHPELIGESRWRSPRVKKAPPKRGFSTDIVETRLEMPVDAALDRKAATHERERA